jgi:hypothetical protein
MVCRRKRTSGLCNLRSRSENRDTLALSPPAADRASSEYLREIIDLILVVGRYRVSLSVKLKRAVLVQHEETDREELKDLARIILVRIRSRPNASVEIVTMPG